MIRATRPALYARSALRIALRRTPSLAAAGRLDDRMVFVVGSPRSGTTFLAGAIGALPGFVDLGETLPLKAAIPELFRLDPVRAAPRIRRILGTTRRLALVAGLRAVEQTPEAAFVCRALPLAFPNSGIVHAVRDGRDVVCSLLERGWLSTGRPGRDDAGLSYGASARFWVEPGREEEFAAATDTRRAAWAWRRYAESAREAAVPVHEIRYEELVADPERTAVALARFLDAPPGPLAASLQAAHGRSVGRFRRDLTPEQLAEVEAEAGTLLADLGYLAGSSR